MGNESFSDICIKLVADKENIDKKDVYVVWLSKVLQNKALVSTTQSNGMYYEITYKGDKEEIYLERKILFR